MRACVRACVRACMRACVRSACWRSLCLEQRCKERAWRLLVVLLVTIARGVLVREAECRPAQPVHTASAFRARHTKAPWTLRPLISAHLSHILRHGDSTGAQQPHGRTAQARMGRAQNGVERGMVSQETGRIAERSMRQARSGNIASFVLRKNLGGGIVRIKFNEREPLGLARLVVALHLLGRTHRRPGSL